MNPASLTRNQALTTCILSVQMSLSSKKKCFSNALGHTLVVLEMH